MTRLLDLALFALIFAVAEAILIFGALPVIWRRFRTLRVRRRLERSHFGKVIPMERRKLP